MKVAFLTYPAAFQDVGGGEIQLLRTKEALEKKGVCVDLFDSWNSRVEAYDVIHAFSSVKDFLGLLSVAKTRKVPVVVSPILWSDWRMTPLRHWAKWFFPAFPSGRRRILQLADRILPNSLMEQKHISRLFAIPEQKMCVIYNAADAAFMKAAPGSFRDQYGKEPFILSVGRIEPRKNQLKMIEAVKGIPGVKLVLVGRPVTGYESYYRECVALGRGFTQWIDVLKHEEALLASAYAACDLLVQPGWFETPALAALEGALAGARVLLTQGGSTREYFEDHVDYLNPSSVADIRKKIRANLGRKADPALKGWVRERYSWERVAERTLDVYRELVSR